MPTATVTCPAFETWIPKPANLNFVQASYFESITKLSSYQSIGNGVIRNLPLRDAQ
jgi:hypothetical protein